jgi:hypothetical protein
VVGSSEHSNEPLGFVAPEFVIFIVIFKPH